MNREEIMEVVLRVTGYGSPVTVHSLALYAGRFMDYCEWEPFIKAALERNPVSIAFFRNMELQEVFIRLLEWPDESIYEGNRLALPDEVANFRRGDGIEKALVLANVIRNRNRNSKITLCIDQKKVLVKALGYQFSFNSEKDFSKILYL